MSVKGDKQIRRATLATPKVNPIVFIERDVAVCSKCQARMFRLGEDLWECFRCGEIERHTDF